jgi:hypothetical protein
MLTAAVVWTAALAGLYAYYYFTHLTWWYLRFLLPAFPAIVLLGLAAVTRLKEALPARWEKPVSPMLAAAIVMTALGGSIYAEREHHVSLMKEYQQPYVAACTWARENLPGDSLIATMQLSSAFYFYTDFTILRWDQIPEENVPRLVAALEGSGRPFYAGLFPFEETDERLGRVKLLREKIAEIKGVSVWKCAPTR